MQKIVKKMKINYKVLAASFVLVILVSFFGSQFTDTTGWYEEIKPSIAPPNFVFPIAWTILYILIALSIYFVWTSSRKKDKMKIILIFGINLIANALWSYLFFGLKNPLYAFYNLIVIWLSIIAMLVISWKSDRKAFYLLIPYLLWVSFAGVLNFLMIS